MTTAQNLASMASVFSSGSMWGRNKIINPSFTINQRGVVGSINTSGYPVDRWHFAVSGGYNSKIGIQLATGAADFSQISDNYVYAFCSTTFASPAAGDYAMLRQFIEGYNVAELAWGTAQAKPITISFKANSTGAAAPFTMCVYVRNLDNTRSHVVPVTINGTGRYSVTIPGCTDGTWNKTNGIGMEVGFTFGSGSTYVAPASKTWHAASYIAVAGQSNIATNTNNTVSLTDVQVEVGTVATPIEWRPFGLEFALCQRYYQTTYLVDSSYQAAGIDRAVTIPLSIQMRANPSVSATAAGTNTNHGTINAGANSSGAILVYSAATATGALRIEASITSAAEL